MAHINVQIPDEMEDELQATIEASGRYLNTSEYVRDALRHQMEEQPRQLSEETLRAIERSEQEIEEGDVWSHEEIKQRLGMDDE
jgi:Arc/MetJ-type ribon-helix-helix transcriptional regulator